MARASSRFLPLGLEGSRSEAVYGLVQVEAERTTDSYGLELVGMFVNKAGTHSELVGQLLSCKEFLRGSVVGLVEAIREAVELKQDYGVARLG
jgi:hypothetical protein